MTKFPDDSAWAKTERELTQAGHDLAKIPDAEYDQHIWADGILLFWEKNKRLPDAFELAFDMLDEWDDPVGTDDAERILGYLR